jgi:glycerol uptake facilitator-like aquaporin
VPGAVLCASFGAKTTLRPVVSVGDVLKPVLRKDSASAHFPNTLTAPSGSPLQALGLELILTLFLMFVVSSVATDVRAVGQAAAIAIGGYVALAATFAGSIAGASMNPARSFGPALLGGT